MYKRTDLDIYGNLKKKNLKLFTLLRVIFNLLIYLFIVVNATFNTIVLFQGDQFLLVEEKEEPRENLMPFIGKLTVQVN